MKDFKFYEKEYVNCTIINKSTHDVLRAEMEANQLIKLMFKLQEAYKTFVSINGKNKDLEIILTKQL